jgi:hypothetical protein
MTTFLSACLPKDPDRQKIYGRVIDFDTKLPIKGAMHGAELTNDSGYFENTFYNNIADINITKDGYKPFHLKVELKFDGGDYKSFTLYNKDTKDSWTDMTHDLENSSSFRVIDGDSLIIELKRK